MTGNETRRPSSRTCSREDGKLDRCGWARTELSIAYHDMEWGVPQHDDRVLFEFLILEGAQAGLSWETILTESCMAGEGDSAAGALQQK